MYFYTVKKSVDISVYGRRHRLEAPGVTLSQDIGEKYIYCGPSMWELVQAEEKIGKENIVLHKKDFFGQFNHKFIQPYSLGKDICEQLKQIASKSPHQNKLKILIINSFGTMMGDTVVGYGALRQVIQHLKVNCDDIEVNFYPMMAWNARPHVESIIGQYSEVQSPILHSITLEDFKKYDAYLDFSKLLMMENYDELPLFDFYLDALGVNPSAIPADEKKPYIAIPESSAIEAKALLAKLSNGYPVISIQFDASTPIRSMPIAARIKIINNLLANYDVCIIATQKIGCDIAKVESERFFDLSEFSSRSVFNYMAILKACDAVISVDSFATHICAGLQIPLLAIYTTILPDKRIAYIKNSQGVLIPDAMSLPGWGLHKANEKWSEISALYEKKWAELDINRHINKLFEMAKIVIKPTQIFASTIPYQAGVNEARVDHPLATLKDKNFNPVWSDNKISVNSLEPGIMIFHRQFLNNLEMIKKIDSLCNAGWLVMADFDDDPDNWSEFRESDYIGFRGVHAVTVSTDKLANKIGRWNENVRTLKNGVLKIFPNKPRLNDRKVRFFYGAINRYDDWSEISSCVHDLIGKNTEKIEFHVVHDRRVFEEIDCEHKFFYDTLSYEKYIQVMHQCDFALLPLKNNQFNQYKSDIKFIECLSSGVIPIASHIVYSDSKKNMDYGIFLEGSSWVDRLSNLIKNPDLIYQMQSKGLEYAKSHLYNGELSIKRAKYYRDLIFKLPILNKQRLERMRFLTISNSNNYREIEIYIQQKIREKKYQDVIKDCSYFIKKHPNQYIFFKYIGLVSLLLQMDDRAIEALNVGLSLHKDDYLLYEYLGVCFGRKKDYLSAEKYFLEAIKLNSGAVNSFINLGDVYVELGRFDEADKLLLSAKKIEPNNGNIFSAIANGLAKRGFLDKAIDAYAKSLQHKVQDRSLVYCRIAQIYGQQLNYKKANQILIAALNDGCVDARVYNQLGIVNKELISELGVDDISISLDYYKKAIQINSQYVEPYCNIALLYLEISDYESSKKYFEKALQIDKNLIAAYINLGALHLKVGEFKKALHYIRYVLSKEADNNDVRWNASMALLGMGELGSGWDLYDCRLRKDEEKIKSFFTHPMWRGEDLTNKSIIVWAEQGVGDEILFASCLPDLMRKGCRITLQCDDRLVPLYRRSFDGIQIVPKSDLIALKKIEEDIDFHIPVTSLPKFFRRKLSDFHDCDAYLVPDEGRVEYWRGKLSELGDGLKVGICWRSMLMTLKRRHHYTELSDWLPIFKTPGVHFINLQYDECESEVRDLLNKYGIHLHIVDGLNLKDDFEDVAALIKSLDLVITVATTVQAVTAGVGTPSLLMTPHSWEFLGAKYNPWAMKTQIFYRGATETWERCIKNVASCLEIYKYVYLNKNYISLKNNFAGYLKSAYDEFQSSELNNHSFNKCYGLIAFSVGNLARVFSVISLFWKKIGELNASLYFAKKSLTIDQGQVDTLSNMGNIYVDLSMYDEAIEVLTKSIDLDSAYSPSYLNRGLAFQKKNQHELAINDFKIAVNLDPKLSEAYHSLGASYQILGDEQEALKYYEKAILLNPKHVGAYSNMGAALVDFERYNEAHEVFQKALQIDQNSQATLHNLSNVKLKIGDFFASYEIIQKVLKVNPKNNDVLINASMALLGMGELGSGWDLYDCRLRKDEEKIKSFFTHPMWRGEDLTNKSIIVWAEQGVGDEILFASCLPDLMRKGCRITLQCDDRLVPLYRRSFDGIQIVPKSDLIALKKIEEDIDFHIPVTSLPKFFRRKLSDFHDCDAYLVPDEGRVEYWRGKLSELGDGLKVGICWRSMLMTLKRRHHYTELSDWLPIFKTPGVHFINLQYDECESEVRDLLNKYGIHLHIVDGLNLKDDFEDVAALIKSLDLVITVATTVQAVTAGVGTPSLLMTPHSWEFLGAKYNPWAMKTQIFYRGATETWERCIKNVAEYLESMVKRC